MYGDVWTGGFSNWYSSVRHMVYGVNCLEVQELDCQNCEGGGSNLPRNLIIIYRSAWSDF